MSSFIRRAIPPILVLIVIASVTFLVVVFFPMSNVEDPAESRSVSSLQSLTDEECQKVCGDDLSNCPEFAIDDCILISIE